MIKKLVVVKYNIYSYEEFKERIKGQTITLFCDPETGRIYEPNGDFEVTGESLETMFRDVTIDE